MTGSGEILCFECGQPIEDPPRLNHHADGDPCEACSERLLLEAPSLLPVEAQEELEQERLASSGEGDPSPETQDAPAGAVLPFPMDDEPA